MAAPTPASPLAPHRALDEYRRRESSSHLPTGPPRRRPPAPAPQVEDLEDNRRLQQLQQRLRRTCLEYGATLVFVSAKADTTALEAIAHSLARVTGWRKASTSYVERQAQLEQELEQSHAAKDEAAAAAEAAQETLAAVTTEVEEETVAQVKKLKKKAKVSGWGGYLVPPGFRRLRTSLTT